MVAGNGLSVACAPDLALGNLTGELLRQLDNWTTGEPQVMAAIKKISQLVERDDEFDSNDFEKLVGAFDTQEEMLRRIREIEATDGESSGEVSSAVDTILNLTQRVKDVAVGIVLQTILDRTPGVLEKTEPLKKFLTGMTESFDGYITYGNLNYDGLALSAMLHGKVPVCDLADPRHQWPVTIEYTDASGGLLGSSATYQVMPLRTSLDTLPMESKYRVRLVHPHGSLVYATDLHGGGTYKFPIKAHRTHGSLSAIRYPKRNFRPAVVLTNVSEKPRIVTEQPFKFAYEVLEKGLRDSDHWLIAGYSFRDKSINELLRRILSEKTTLPKILVSTFEDDLDYDLVYRELGIGWLSYDPPNILSVNRDGIEKLTDSFEWYLFKG